eukprot:1394878-Amorphochlora_amoeboformis.AAC.1
MPVGAFSGFHVSAASAYLCSVFHLGDVGDGVPGWREPEEECLLVREDVLCYGPHVLSKTQNRPQKPKSWQIFIASFAVHSQLFHFRTCQARTSTAPVAGLNTRPRRPNPTPPTNPDTPPAAAPSTGA